MYEADEQVRLEELTALPQCDVGSPSPQIFAHEHGLLLVYSVQVNSKNWEQGVPSSSFALFRFLHPQAHSFGPPNDEAINGHPLYTIGLGPYSCYQVLNSPWIKLLEQRNSVHPSHRPEAYKRLAHYIFTFHDSTFECIARSFEFQILGEQARVAAEFAKEFHPSW